MLAIVVAALLAALITASVTPAVQRWSEERGAVDQPDARRVNTAPMPRAGGIAICIGFFVAVLVTVTARQLLTPGQHTWTLQIVGILVGALFVSLVGLVDDFRNLKAKWQALAIAAGAFILCAFGVRIEGISNLFTAASDAAYNAGISWHPLSTSLSVAATIIWVFVITKTVDAVDGVDGLAAGICAISSVALALMAVQLHRPEFATLAIIAAALAGSCLGFLRYNFHPAKIIMGTIGAWLLGFVLAAISILGAFKSAAAVSVLVPVLVLGVPIFDYTHVVGRRLLEGAPLTQADKRHLHHRLLARGWNQKQVVLCIYSVAVVLCGIALALFRAGRYGR